MLQWGGLCVWSCGAGSCSGALVDLLRSQGSSHHSQGLDSFTAARAKRGWGIVTLAEGGPHALLSPATSEGCPVWLWAARSLQQSGSLSLSLSPTHVWQPPGPPAAEWIFMLSPGFDISVDQSNISQVFFFFFFYWLLECARLA